MRTERHVETNGRNLEIPRCQRYENVATFSFVRIFYVSDPKYIQTFQLLAI
jgi:hypothetical protein